jgi:hypothetical protein
MAVMKHPARDSLFGDMPLGFAVAESAGTEFGHILAQAQASMAAGDGGRARGLFEQAALLPAIESRHRLEAWFLLREAGGQPPENLANHLLAVMVEVGMNKGSDLLAVYADGTAHYHNFSGAAVIWLHPDTSLDDKVQRVLSAGEAIVSQIGPWEGKRRPAPAAGIMRLTMLTPTGLFFGEGPFEALQKNHRARSLVMASTRLMATLTSLPPA